MSWRNRLLPASFGFVPFHVEGRARSGGRNLIVHDYPFRNQPYTEDITRSARTFSVTGYTIGDNYDIQLAALAAVCESLPQGLLILPTHGAQLVACEFFTTSEVREEGNYGVIDMNFVEKGRKPGVSIAPTANVNVAALAAASAASAAISALRSGL